jgi:hypothetical protein
VPGTDYVMDGLAWSGYFDRSSLSGVARANAASLPPFLPTLSPSPADYDRVCSSGLGYLSNNGGSVLSRDSELELNMIMQAAPGRTT